MRLLMALDNHFCRNAGGEVYAAPPAVVGYRFWQSYLRVFGEVLVLARVRSVVDEGVNAARADGPGVSFLDLPDYLGPWQYLWSISALRARVRQAAIRADAFILRAPSAVGQLLWKELRGRHRAYGVEVIADPWDMYSPGGVPSVVRPVVRRLWTRQLRRICRAAPAVTYVTAQALQERYPPGPRSWSTYASDVELSDGMASEGVLQARAERFRGPLGARGSGAPRLRIGFLGSLAQMYKRPDILLQAAADCVRRGWDLEVVLAGDGKFRQTLEGLASQLGIRERVQFLGSLSPGPAIQDFLDHVDLFVLPSQQEGLPRALVEAMARGCPCLGSTVGGIPELLPSEALVAPGDPGALATKLREVCIDPEKMAALSRRNWEKAKEYLPQVLETRRLDFCRKVRDLASQPGDVS